MNRFKYTNDFSKPNWRALNSISPGQIWKCILNQQQGGGSFIKIIKRYKWEELGSSGYTWLVEDYPKRKNTPDSSIQTKYIRMNFERVT